MPQLAVDGGDPIRTTPFPARHLFGEREKAAAIALFDQAIDSGTVFGYNGPEEQAYESEFAAYLGGGYADMVSSGTAAVLVALGALRLEPLSEVIVPPISDPGGVMPVPMLNCVPVVADAHPGSYNVGAEQIEAVLSPRTRAIIVAHIAGEPVDMDPVLELARAHGLHVIEDCAQAHGALYKGRPVGTLGTIASFSTMSGKHHATGAQGGVVFTQDEDLYWEAKRFADRGKPFNTEHTTNVRMGLNLNGNDLSAAIGRVQLSRLPDIIARRCRFVETLTAEMTGLRAVRLGWIPDGAEAVYWFLRPYLDRILLTVDKATFVDALRAEGIPCSLEYRAVQSESVWFKERVTYGTSGYPWTAPEYAGDPEPVFSIPNCMDAIESHFHLPLHEGYAAPEARDIAAALRKLEAAYLK
jgi:dTDP-4-amino-4,6-dideoxygalactose transaminase